MAKVSAVGAVTTVPEFIDPVFAKTSRKRAFSMTKNERFGLVFTKTGSINSGTAVAVLPAIVVSDVSSVPAVVGVPTVEHPF